MKFPRALKIKVIETKGIELGNKDVLYLKDGRDFIDLLSVEQYIFKLGNNYYILSSDVAYVFCDNLKRNRW